MTGILNRNRPQASPEDTAAFAGVAERFRRAGDLDRAITLCRQGLKKFPDLLSARVTLGWALLDKGAYDEARTELEQVLRRAPDNLAAIRGLAQLHDHTDHGVHMDGESWAHDSHDFQQDLHDVEAAAGTDAAGPADGSASEPELHESGAPSPVEPPARSHSSIDADTGHVPALPSWSDAPLAFPTEEAGLLDPAVAAGERADGDAAAADPVRRHRYAFGFDAAQLALDPPNERVDPVALDDMFAGMECDAAFESATPADASGASGLRDPLAAPPADDGSASAQQQRQIAALDRLLRRIRARRLQLRGPSVA